MLSDVLQAGAVKWLETTGEQVSYMSALTGQSVLVTATLEQEVDTVDDGGMVTRGQTLCFNSVDVPLPAKDDIVTLADGRRFHLDAVLDSPGYITRAYVSPA